MAKRLFLLAVLAAGVWWYWTRWRPQNNYRALSGQLEAAVNQELAAAGITDKESLQNLHQERSRLGVSWIESNRRFQVPPNQWSPLLDRLSAKAQTLGCRVMRRTESKDDALLELGKGKALMQRVQLVPPGTMVQAFKQPVVALVIDDVAYDLDTMDHFAALGVPLTFAILPRDKKTKALANKAVQLNFPVIIHMPMEPEDLAHNNPGPSGLYLKMTPEQLHKQFEKNVASVPHIQGINNHMGSAFTEDLPHMQLVMGWVKEKKLFFLDSHTTQKSVVSKVAKAAGVPCLINETFLDNEDTAEYIEKQLDLVLKLALKRHQTIAIGHYRRKHLVEALARKLPEFKAHGVTLVTLPSLYPKAY